MTKRLLAAAVAVLVALSAVWVFQSEPARSETGPFSSPAVIKGPIAITVPGTLGGMAALGASAFAKNCVSCHGENGVGSDNGPPLVHVIYEPGHHGDGAFYRAAMQGVRAHHWRFGDMPPVEGVTEAQIGAIVAYIRTLQRANGIE